MTITTQQKAPTYVTRSTRQNVGMPTRLHPLAASFGIVAAVMTSSAPVVAITGSSHLATILLVGGATVAAFAGMIILSSATRQQRK